MSNYFTNMTVQTPEGRKSVQEACILVVAFFNEGLSCAVRNPLRFDAKLKAACKGDTNDQVDTAIREQTSGLNLEWSRWFQFSPDGGMQVRVHEEDALEFQTFLQDFVNTMAALGLFDRIADRSKNASVEVVD